MSIITFAQPVAYDRSGARIKQAREENDLTFHDSELKLNEGGEENALGIIPLLPGLVDLSFKIGSKILENDVKKYVAEYAKQQSNIDLLNEKIPAVRFRRTLHRKGVKAEETAFELTLKPGKIDSFEAFYFYVDVVELKYSKAKVTRKRNCLDYTIEIKPVFIEKGKKVVLETYPLVLTSVGFGKHEFGETRKYRTGLIPIPKQAYFAEFSIKIVESNPVKVKAEKFVEAFNEFGEDAKTIINNYLPKLDSKESSEQEDPPADDPYESVGKDGHH